MKYLRGSSLLAAMFAAWPISAFADELKLETYLPVPLATYGRLTTTGKTQLARDGGRVWMGLAESGLGSPIPGGAATRLIAAGNGERIFEVRTALDDPLPGLPAHYYNPLHIGYRARGTQAAPVPVQNGDVLLKLTAHGYVGAPANMTPAAIYQISIDGPATPTSVPGRIEFLTNPPGCVYPCWPATRVMMNSIQRVGINTQNPLSRLHVVDPGGALLRLDGGLTTRILFVPDPQIFNGWELGLQGTHFLARNWGGAGLAAGIKLADDGRAYFGLNVSNAVPAPGRKIDTDLANAYMDMTGRWPLGSSRGLKDDIARLSFDDAAQTLDQLQPVTFRYKRLPDEKRAGFIAEDVPDLVATPARDGLHVMDIEAVLTRVIQEQRRRLEEHRERARLIENRLTVLEKRLGEEP